MWSHSSPYSQPSVNLSHHSPGVRSCRAMLVKGLVCCRFVPQLWFPGTGWSGPCWEDLSCADWSWRLCLWGGVLQLVHEELPQGHGPDSICLSHSRRHHFMFHTGNSSGFLINSRQQDYSLASAPFDMNESQFIRQIRSFLLGPQTSLWEMTSHKQQRADGTAVSSGSEDRQSLREEVPVREEVKTALTNQAEEANAPFLCLSILFRPSVNWMRPSHMEECDPLYSVLLFKCPFLLETPSETHPEILLKQISGYPVAWSHWYIKWTDNPCGSLDKGPHWPREQLGADYGCIWLTETSTALRFLSVSTLLVQVHMRTSCLDGQVSPLPTSQFQRSKAWQTTEKRIHILLAKVNSVMQQGLCTRELCDLKPDTFFFSFRTWGHDGFSHWGLQWGSSDRMTMEVLCAQLSENNGDCSHWPKRCTTCPWIRWSQSLACLSNSATGRPLVREVLWQEFDSVLQRGTGPWVVFSHLVPTHAEGWDIDLTLLGML